MTNERNLKNLQTSQNITTKTEEVLWPYGSKPKQIGYQSTSPLSGVTDRESEDNMTNAMHDILVLAVNKVEERDFEHLDEIIEEYDYEEIIEAWIEFIPERYYSYSIMQILREFYTIIPKPLNELEIY